MTNVEVSVFKHFQNTKDPHNVSIDKILTFIRDGRWRESIEILRGKKTKEEKDELKKNLPMVLFSGKFTERKDTAISEYSGYMIVDFDNVDRPDITKQQIIKSKYVYSAFISPSGNGVKALVRVNATDDKTFKDTFNALYEYFDRKIDKSGKNVSRGCFVSYDSNLYINDNAEIFSFTETPKEKIIIKDNKLFSEIYSYAKLIKDVKKNFIKSNRNNFIFELACICFEYGIPEDILVQYMVKDFEDVDFPVAEIKRTVQSALIKIGNEFGTKKYWKREIYDMAREMIVKDKRRDVEGIAKELSDKYQLSYGDTLLMVDYIFKQDVKIYETFWKVRPDPTGSGNPRYEIDKQNFIYFLEKNGYHRHKKNDKEYMYVTFDSNIIEEFHPDNFQSIIRNYLESLPDKIDGVQKNRLINGVMKSCSSLFSPAYLKFIGEHTLEPHKSDKDSAYLYFKNKVVKVTADNVEVLDYLYINGYIWKNQIIDYNYEFNEGDYKGEYYAFIERICGGHPDKIRYAMQIIGYLLHDYKIRDQTYAIILVDESIGDLAEGGTGKGIFVQALTKLKQVVEINGKDDNDAKNFRFQRIQPDTQIAVFQDIKKNFNFKSFYNFVTEGIEIEEKFKAKYFIKFEDTPKIVITTNYAVQSYEQSTMRRLRELEFGAYYNIDRTPKMEFGHLLFDDWDKTSKEWNRFYNFCIKCIQMYLKDGIDMTGVIFENVKLKKFVQYTCKEFVEWLIDKEKDLKQPVTVKSLRDEFVLISDMPEVTSLKFRKWLSVVKIYTKWRNADSFKYTNGHQYFSLLGRPPRLTDIPTGKDTDVNELF